MVSPRFCKAWLLRVSLQGCQGPLKMFVFEIKWYPGAGIFSVQFLPKWGALEVCLICIFQAGAGTTGCRYKGLTSSRNNLALCCCCLIPEGLLRAVLLCWTGELWTAAQAAERNCFRPAGVFWGHVLPWEGLIISQIFYLSVWWDSVPALRNG